MTTNVQREQFARSIVDYCLSGTDMFVSDSARQWYRDGAYDAVMVLMNDIGAAQEFCNVLGLKVDLYEYRFVN